MRRVPLTACPAHHLIGTMLSEAASGSMPADDRGTRVHPDRECRRPGFPWSKAGCPSIETLTAEVGEARQAYQACRYAELAMLLPGLLARLDEACTELLGDARSQARALSADAHHVAAGLLLKLDDQGLASLAADRSMRAAQASEDPVTIGASARIITHTLMSGRHLPAAVSAASSHAARLDRDIEPHTSESLSVYGALLLRGSIAAAQNGNRGAAHELVSEAEEAARRLGRQMRTANLRWTAFGPANAMVHRVNIAVTLGDAGTAIDIARRVDLSKLTVTERKATLLLDVSRAFLQWGRHETGLHRSPCSRGHRTRGSRRAPLGAPARPRPAHHSSGGHPPGRRPVRHADRGNVLTGGRPGRVLSLVVCGAGPATEIGTFVRARP